MDPVAGVHPPHGPARRPRRARRVLRARVRRAEDTRPDGRGAPPRLHRSRCHHGPASVRAARPPLAAGGAWDDVRARPPRPLRAARAVKGRVRRAPPATRDGGGCQRRRPRHGDDVGDGFPRPDGFHAEVIRRKPGRPDENTLPRARWTIVELPERPISAAASGRRGRSRARPLPSR